MARGDNIIHDYCLLKISELCLSRFMSAAKMQHDNSIRVSQVCLHRQRWFYASRYAVSLHLLARKTFYLSIVIWPTKSIKFNIPQQLFRLKKLLQFYIAALIFTVDLISSDFFSISNNVWGSKAVFCQKITRRRTHSRVVVERARFCSPAEK